MKLRLAPLLPAMLAGVASTSAMATEGALGRSMTGTQITPYVGIIPLTPGFQFSASYINYSGDIGGSKQVPIAGAAALNLHANVNLPAATIAYIWDTKPGRWNFASMLTVPARHTGVPRSGWRGLPPRTRLRTIPMVPCSTWTAY